MPEYVDLGPRFAFEKPYKKVGKHRHKCLRCGKLIQDGEPTHFQKVHVIKYYPVKGKMEFPKWIYTHSFCKETDNA